MSDWCYLSPEPVNVDMPIPGEVNVKVPVHELLPRLCELASQRGNNQTRTLAAESLHAAILFLVSPATILVHPTLLIDVVAYS